MQIDSVFKLSSLIYSSPKAPWEEYSSAETRERADMRHLIAAVCFSNPWERRSDFVGVASERIIVKLQMSRLFGLLYHW